MAGVAQLLQTLAGGEGGHLDDVPPGGVVDGAHFAGEDQSAGFGFRQLQVLEPTEPGQGVRAQKVVEEQADDELLTIGNLPVRFPRWRPDLTQRASAKARGDSKKSPPHMRRAARRLSAARSG